MTHQPDPGEARPRPRYPAPLMCGDLIAVTAPSSGVPEHLHTRLDLGLDYLRAAGFAVEEGTCLRSQAFGASSTATARAAELMGFLLRDEVAAIIPPWGGELAIDLLDRMDWYVLKRARPKWVLGYSDISTLLLPLALRLNWATVHGPNLMDMVSCQDEVLTKNALSVLSTPEGGSFKQVQSNRWQRNWPDFSQVPDAPFHLTEPTSWRCLNRSGKVHARGRLVGGCLDTLMHIAGTAHGDLPGFTRRYAEDGVLVYLENGEQSPTALVRALYRLRWSGWLDGINGLLIGRSAAPDTTEAASLRYADALAQTLGELPCPVLMDVDIGHLPPQFTLVNGALAELNWSESGGGVIHQQLV